MKFERKKKNNNRTLWLLVVLLAVVALLMLLLPDVPEVPAAKEAAPATAGQVEATGDADGGCEQTETINE